jgi:uncharacterized RDD family membrane protein YckC
MNLDQIKNQKSNPPSIDDMEFDFKPITSGLGFHHQKTTEIKPVITERTVVMSPMPNPSAPLPKKEMSVYQSDLSLFYGQNSVVNEPIVKMEEVPENKYYKTATVSQRVLAYLADLLLVASILAIVLTVMARTISMDLVEVWGQYPNEITPLVLTLFCGFYLIYFSIFEKASQSTLGKNIFNLRVTGTDNNSLSLITLVARSSISLLNFISLGLFSWFDLQNKVTSSKVIRID